MEFAFYTEKNWEKSIFMRFNLYPFLLSRMASYGKSIKTNAINREGRALYFRVKAKSVDIGPLCGGLYRSKGTIRPVVQSLLGDGDGL